MVPLRLRNRLYVSYGVPGGRDCKVVGPDTPCFCTHRCCVTRSGPPPDPPSTRPPPSLRRRPPYALANVHKRLRAGTSSTRPTLRRFLQSAPCVCPAGPPDASAPPTNTCLSSGPRLSAAGANTCRATTVRWTHIRARNVSQSSTLCSKEVKEKRKLKTSAHVSLGVLFFFLRRHLLHRLPKHLHLYMCSTELLPPDPGESQTLPGPTVEGKFIKKNL